MPTYEIRMRQANDYRVARMRLPKNTQRVSPWPDLFAEADPNIFLLAKKKTGKTTVLYNLLKWGTNRNTIVIFFVSTLYKDPSYVKIVSMLKKKKVPYILETSFKNKETGVDQLESLIEYLKSRGDKVWDELRDGWNGTADSDSDCDYESGSEDDSEFDEEPEYDNDDKWRYIIVCDDMSKEMRTNTNFNNFLKENRHYRFTTLIASQDISDLPPASLNQLQYVLAFSKIPEDPKNNRLAKLWSSLSINLPYDVFRAMYHDATDPDEPGKKSHSFLQIDSDNNLFRKDFTHPLNIRVRED